MKIRRYLLTLTLALLATSGWASDSADKACIEQLSQGRNRLHLKPNLSALQNLLKARQKNAAQITEKDVALLVDYSMNSKDKRSYLVDFKSCDILMNEYTIHGGTVYKPKLDQQGDPNNDGMLDKCINRDGNHKNMTRPGAFVTVGCHSTQEKGWSILSNGCAGIKLNGLEKRNADVLAAGVVLHEHKLIPNNSSIKPVGQGCPAFPIGKLNTVLKYGSDKGMLVYLNAPQCK